jgi:hypothetical protein
VRLDKPDDRGLPSGDEFNRLNALEDELAAIIQPKQGIQVGRLTHDGSRYLYFYTALDEADAHALATRIGSVHGYDIAVRHEADAEHKVYWNELFPTDDDWQVIQDMRVQDALEKEGDRLTTPRPIEHWAYFKTESDRTQFVKAVQSHFDEVECFLSPESKHGEFAAQLRHVGLPDYRSMNSTTLLLRRAACAANGDYDGWETRICRD